MPDAMQPTRLTDDDQDDRRVGRSRSGVSCKDDICPTMLAMD